MNNFDTTDTPVSQARRVRGWSQKRAADAVQVDQATWSRVERGLQMPSSALVLKMAGALDLTADQVLLPWSSQTEANAA